MPHDPSGAAGATAAPAAAPAAPGEAPRSRADLPPAARRALAEAEERRRLRDAEAAAEPAPREIDGRRGPEPVRYGDWEKKGIAVDF